MKRIIFIIIAIGVSLTSFACTYSQLQKKNKQLKSELIACYHQKDSINTLLENMQKNLDRFKNKMDSLKQENDNLKYKNKKIEEEKNFIDSTLSSYESLRMLIRYPLMNKYDSASIAYSCTLIEKLKMQEATDDNKKYYNHYFQYLLNYSKYNDEIYNILNNIERNYMRFGEKYSSKNFEQDYKKSSYYNDGAYIPYLDEIIKYVKELIATNKLTIKELKEILDKLK